MNKYMQEALKEGYKGIRAGHGGPFGAVIVKDGKIIAKDHNRVLETNDPTAHAEMCAIREACKKLHTYDLTGCVLYCTGYSCPMCMAACQWANIQKIYYGCSLKDCTKIIGFRDELFYADKLNTEQIDRKECLELYKEFAGIKNKKMY